MAIIAAGTGSGCEAQMLGSLLRARATPIDLGHRAVKNCATQAPLARVLYLPGERLAGVPDDSTDRYFASRLPLRQFWLPGKTYEVAGYLRKVRWRLSSSAMPILAATADWSMDASGLTTPSTGLELWVSWARLPMQHETRVRRHKVRQSRNRNAPIAVRG